MIPITPIQIQAFEKYNSIKSFAEQFKPANLIILYDDINTIEESIAEERLTLADIDYLYSGRDVFAGIEYVSSWIKYIQEFLNIMNQLPKPIDVGVMIYKQYKHFYLTDLKLIFEKILRSEYGSFYGSVDAQRILTSFHKYNTERNTILRKSIENAGSRVTDNIKTIEKDLKNKIWEDLQSEKIKSDNLWPELDRRFKEQLPGILEREYKQSLKENTTKILSDEK